MLTATLHVVALHSGTFEPNSFQILDPTIWLRRNWSQTHLIIGHPVPHIRSLRTSDPSHFRSRYVNIYKFLICSALKKIHLAKEIKCIDEQRDAYLNIYWYYLFLTRNTVQRSLNRPSMYYRLISE